MMSKLAETYKRLGEEAEKIAYSMMISTKINFKDFESLNLLEMMKSVHEANVVSVNFEEGEVLIQGRYELHSVSGNRNDDGEVEVYINIVDLQDNDPNSIRMSEFPHIGDLLTIMEAVEDKCSIKLDNDEEE